MGRNWIRNVRAVCQLTVAIFCKVLGARAQARTAWLKNSEETREGPEI